MIKGIKAASVLVVLAFACTVAVWPQQAQSPESALSFRNSPEHYYRLDFRVLEFSAQGKVTDSRSYSEMIASGPKSEKTSSIRTDDRVPVTIGSHAGASTGLVSTLVNSEYEYIDMGTNIDAEMVQTIDQTLRLYVTANLDAMSSASPATSSRPITRRIGWHSYVTVPIGKPAIIFSSDNNADKGKTELELTAVPLDK
jgi:hypothetical protein